MTADKRVLEDYPVLKSPLFSSMIGKRVITRFCPSLSQRQVEEETCNNSKAQASHLHRVIVACAVFMNPTVGVCGETCMKPPKQMRSNISMNTTWGAFAMNPETSHSKEALVLAHLRKALQHKLPAWNRCLSLFCLANRGKMWVFQWQGYARVLPTPVEFCLKTP